VGVTQPLTARAAPGAGDADLAAAGATAPNPAIATVARHAAACVNLTMSPSRPSAVLGYIR